MERLEQYQHKTPKIWDCIHSMDFDISLNELWICCGRFNDSHMSEFIAMVTTTYLKTAMTAMLAKVHKMTNRIRTSSA